MFLTINKINLFFVGLLMVGHYVQATNIQYDSLTFNQLKGWKQATLIDQFNDYLRLANDSHKKTTETFKKELAQLDKTNNAKIKKFIETHYEPVLITDTQKEHLITGYHIFHAKADYQQSAQYPVPIYQKPSTAQQRYHSHEAVLDGALHNKGLELAWLQDSIDVYLLMMQGSGLLTFTDGDIKKVVYAGSNGYGYQSISQYMLDKKLITHAQRNGPFIKQYLKNDLKRAKEIIIQNPSYVFFKFDKKQAFSGAAGSALKAMQSLAVDKQYYPFHSLIWLETAIPNNPQRFRNLVIAQDTGGAIKGPQRGDLFFGIKKEVEQDAGLMKDKNARLIMLRLRNND
ncbi:hypothetical protein CL658_01695 [bacterium]|nr:hypothetical protein [bacterium]